MRKSIFAFSLTILFACADDPFVDLEDGWNRITPGGETVCSDGSEYAFWFRPGSTDSLSIYFQGGGACWFGEICALDRNPTYKPNVSDDDVPASNGIFDFGNPENPIAQHSVLFIPYCTGDVHVGDRTVTYDVEPNDSLPARSFEIQHRGVANAQAALDWVYSRVTNPSLVFVTGVSAGSLGSSYHAPFIAGHYSRARVEQLGDAAGGYRGEQLAATLRTWGNHEVTPDWPEYSNADSTNFVTFYLAAGHHAPNLRMSQVNYHADEVQLSFLALEGISGVSLVDLLDANLADISDGLPSFRSYTIAGDTHGIIPFEAFYTVEVDGVRIRDWVAGLVDGEDIPTVACDECR